MHANERESVDEAKAGQIVRRGRAQARRDGRHALPQGDAVRSRGARLSRRPSSRWRSRPRPRDDKEKLGEVLQKLAREDPTFRYSVDARDRAADHLRDGRAPPRDHPEPHRARLRRSGERRQAARRVTARRIGGHAEVNHKYAKQSGGRGQFAQVMIEVEPAPGEGVVFENEIKGGNIPREYIPAVEAGARAAAEGGCGQGYPVIDVTSRSRTASTTRSTPRTWRSTSAGRWRSRRPRRRPASSSSSRS